MVVAASGVGVPMSAGGCEENEAVRGANFEADRGLTRASGPGAGIPR
jgi:hypothetical protein